jgi:Rps23 Pro-64 3,4-dihydroxylase Tpa1-like proline 4-hydroxylase
MEEINQAIHLDKLNNQNVIQAPFAHFCIDNILDESFANEVYNAFPSYEEAKSLGHEFIAINEKRKIQITDHKKFPQPILALHQILASKAFVSKVEKMTGIQNLIPDPDLVGGGIHETNSGGHLDVHVDFNYIPEKKLHRRVNILFYFNKDWKEEYGGYLDIWDKNVKKRYGYFEPKFNRACGFATGEYSWHGVTPLTCPQNVMRKSFAVYYYTKEAPPGWDGKQHSTIFKARPEEWVKGHIAMPIDHAVHGVKNLISGIKTEIKSMINYD